MSARTLREAERLEIEWANIEDGWLPEWWSLDEIVRGEDGWRCIAGSVANGVRLTAEGRGDSLVQAMDRVAVNAHVAEANMRALRVHFPTGRRH